ncbi:MAG: cation transporter [Myxococcota bacterium]
MESCCENEARALARLRERQAGVLRVVLVVNLAMFFVEFGAGLRAGSTGLLSDSLDMLGDAFVYAFTLYVLALNQTWRGIAALTKGILMALLGAGVLVEAASKMYAGEVPVAQAMAVFATLALAANAVSYALLYRHRSDDVNLRSTWLCTRNDLIANVAVLAAAGMVYRTQAIWPDLVVGIAIAALFLKTAVGVIRDALREIRAGDMETEDEPPVISAPPAGVGRVRVS